MLVRVVLETVKARMKLSAYFKGWTEAASRPKVLLASRSEMGNSWTYSMDQMKTTWSGEAPRSTSSSLVSVYPCFTQPKNML